MQPPARVLLVDGSPSRRAQRAAALRDRGQDVVEADDVVGALKLLPSLGPDVLVVATDGLAMDLETLVRGVRSIQACEHLQILAVGEARPLSSAVQGQVSLLPDEPSAEPMAKESERLATRARRRKPAP